MLLLSTSLAGLSCGTDESTTGPGTTTDLPVAIDTGAPPLDVANVPDLGQPDSGQPTDLGPPDTGPADVAPGDLTAPDDGAPDIPRDLGSPDDGKPTDEGNQPDDGVCVPKCEGRMCGGDECGGICGYCPYPKVCDAEGQCVTVCVQDCVDKFCGGDGCGGVCGACPEGLDCGEDGLCYEPTCEPDCLGKACGPDGCGSDCGLCVDPEICTDGSCGLGPCGAVGAGGQCVGNTAVWCVGGSSLVEDDCTQYADHVCKYDGWFNQYLCQEQGECVPQCAGKLCGSDACGGSCGVCSQGWACVQGACQPEPGGDCGSITSLGQCISNTLWFCSNGKLNTYACPQGETCEWDASQQSFDCL